MTLKLDSRSLSAEKEAKEMSLKPTLSIYN